MSLGVVEPSLAITNGFLQAKVKSRAPFAHLPRIGPSVAGDRQVMQFSPGVRFRDGHVELALHRIVHSKRRRIHCHHGEVVDPPLRSHSCRLWGYGFPLKQ